MTATKASPSHVRVEPVASSIGAVINGVDARQPLDDAAVSTIRQALLDYKVVFLRGQHLDIDQQTRFAEHFGELREHPIVPFDDFDYLKQAGISARADHWHTDMAFLPDPPYGSILSLPIIPAVGGDTMWVDLEAAYDGLSEPVRNLVDGLVGVHYADSFQDWAWSPNIDEQRRFEILSWSARGVEHPLVHVHPDTGRKSLYAVTGWVRRIKGLSREESAGILALLHAHVDRPEYTLRYAWGPGDLAFWDNRTTLHRGVNDYGDAERPLQRVTVAAFANR